jgi:hypothetical protein
VVVKIIRGTRPKLKALHKGSAPKPGLHWLDPRSDRRLLPLDPPHLGHLEGRALLLDGGNGAERAHREPEDPRMHAQRHAERQPPPPTARALDPFSTLYAAAISVLKASCSNPEDSRSGELSDKV